MESQNRNSPSAYNTTGQNCRSRANNCPCLCLLVSSILSSILQTAQCRFRNLLLADRGYRICLVPIFLFPVHPCPPLQQERSTCLPVCLSVCLSVNCPDSSVAWKEFPPSGVPSDPSCVYRCTPPPVGIFDQFSGSNLYLAGVVCNHLVKGSDIQFLVSGPPLKITEHSFSSL